MNIQWNSRHWTSVNEGQWPWEMKSKRDEPHTMLTALEFPSCVTGRRNAGKAQESPLHWDEEAEECGEHRYLRFVDSDVRDKQQTENIELSQQTTDQCMHLRKLLKDREKPPKGNSAQHTHKVRTVPTLTARTGKIPWFMGTQEALSSVMENNSF